MKAPSPQLLALYERCLIGSLLACEISIRELDLAVDDFSDPKAQRMFGLLAELDEDSPLAYPTAFGLAMVSVPPSENADTVRGYLVDAYADFVSRDTALSYARIVATHGKARRARRGVVAQLARRAG